MPLASLESFRRSEERSIKRITHRTPTTPPRLPCLGYLLALHPFMKRSAILITSLAILSLLSGFLLSKASLLGKAGMTLFYQEYNFLKSWWKGALLVFIVLMILYVVQGLLQKNKPTGKQRLINMLAIVLALTGWLFTYLDFRNVISHRLLGTSFHIGAYLFWLGWIAISIYYLTGNRSLTSSSMVERSA